MNLIYKITKVLLFVFCFYANAYGYSILLDPGHGGADQGASSKLYVRGKNGKRKAIYVYEKDLALQFAKRIYTKLQKKYSVFLTRSVDRTVSLEERAELADKIKADLIISVHMNSSFGRNSNGFETYYLDNHKDVAIKKVEEVENKGLKGDALIVQQILTDLVVSKTVSTSKSLAKFVHTNISKGIKRRYGMKDRGIKPGLFYILALSKRPGILLEVGFMSNPKSLNKMRQRQFQEIYAKAVARGIDQFVRQLTSNKISLF